MATIKSIKAGISIVSPSSEQFEEGLTLETSTFKLFAVTIRTGQFTISTPVTVWSSIVLCNTFQWLVFHSVPTQENKNQRNSCPQQTIAAYADLLVSYQISNLFIKKNIYIYIYIYLKEMLKFFIVLSS